MVQLKEALSKQEETFLIMPEEYKPFLVENRKRLRNNTFLFKKYKLTNPLSFYEAFRISKFINKLKPDVIHFQAADWIRILMVMKLCNKVNFVSTIHDPYPHLGETGITKVFGKKSVISNSNGLIFHGEKMKSFGLNIFNLSHKKVHSFPLGPYELYTDYDRSNVDILTQEIINDNFIILMFGRFYEYKGLSNLIKIEKILSRITDKKYKIILAGQGPDLDKHITTIKNNTNFIVIDKFITEKEVNYLFANSSIVALPYIEATQSGVIPISLAFKKPVITFDVGSLSEYILDGKTGIIVDPNDYNSFAENINRMMNSGDDLAIIVSNIEKYIANKNNWDLSSHSLIQFFRGLDEQ